MNRTQATQQITRSTSIIKENLKRLSAQQVIDLAQGGEFIMTREKFEEFCIERNEKAKRNSRLGLENKRLEAELQARQDGQTLRRCIKKDLAEMTDAQLKEYGLVTIKAANARIIQMEKEAELYVADMEKTYDLFEKDK